jgi:hypothetical protein
MYRFTLEQGSPNYGPQAGCGLPYIFIWPVNVWLINVLKIKFENYMEITH